MRHLLRPARAARLLFSVLILLLLPLHPARAEIPAWVEPRALSIVDLAGAVPDTAIAGHILSYGGPGGLRVYESSQIEGDKLRIHARLYPRFFWDPGLGQWLSVVGALGHRPVLDRMSSSAPESWVRLYDGGVDVTDQVLWSDYADPDLVWPMDPAGDPRYSFPSHQASVPRPIPPEGIHMPANWGGYLTLPGERRELRAVYTVALGQRPAVAYLGEETFTFPSYIGPGYVGWFEKLMKQMRSRYDDRHPRLDISPHPQANYILFVYEPMPFDLDVGYWAGDRDAMAKNVRQPVAGTVRLGSGGWLLSQDLQHGGPFPFRAWWEDADRSAGPYLTLRDEAVDKVTPPEFVVLSGTPWDPCYVEGGCSASRLQAIYEARATLKVVYLSVQPSLSDDWVAVPLRFADTNWHAGVGAAEVGALSASGMRGAVSAAQPKAEHRVYLPLVLRMPPPPQIPVPDERPVGFFERVSGRMVGYWAE